MANNSFDDMNAYFDDLVKKGEKIKEEAKKPAEPVHFSFESKPAPITVQVEKQKPKANPGRKEYTYANGRSKKTYTGALYGDNQEYCRTKGIEMGFTSGPVNFYINYLIDKDRGFIKEEDIKK